MTEHALTAQLADPHADGATIALYRTRVYRFSPDPRHYVLAETLEEKWARGAPIAPRTMHFLRACLEGIRKTSKPLPFREDIAAREGVDVQQELDARAPYRPRNLPEHTPRATVFIVGAPRSGTSHLYNLLARTGRYAYFTTASCWAWPVRNLQHAARTSFEDLGEEVLQVDNKKTRLIPRLVMPYEAEDLYARTVPVYRHLGSHTYDIHTPRTADTELFTANVQAHCQHFRRPWFLTKSPFNSLRIPHLDKASNQALFLHIIRDQNSTADSMRRNGFRFHHQGQPLSEEDAWRLFTSAVTRDTPPSRTLTVQHHELLADTRTTMARTCEWIASQLGE